MAEPVVDYKNKDRCDAYFLFNLKPTMIDVSVVNSLANSYVAAAAIPLGAAKLREREKARNYEERVRALGCDFYPFVMESTGGFGPQAEKFIEKFVEDVSMQAPIPCKVASLTGSERQRPLHYVRGMAFSAKRVSEGQELVPTATKTFDGTRTKGG